ncbi:hypothetical protein C2845_PM05G21040 [Panicum miliaceum]|uniref:Uncharacterized protein n=1 Tax=Panicum miliaceum TaxID=4540 RepID=A0A3L6T050_PANMI|nr:hypothetical protein C2845_PM05G21040 [Panicum miliaceum]
MKNLEELHYDMPQNQNELLWREFKAMFTLPEGVDEELVKKCALKKMVLAFSTFKKKLFGNFIKKDKEPDWNKLPQLKPYWRSSNITSCPRKKINYLRRETEMRPPKKIQLTTTSEPVDIERRFRNGKRWSRTSWIEVSGRLSQEDGSLIVPLTMEEVARDLVTAIEDAIEGTFEPRRENDELTRALKNPEHPG